MASWRRWLKYAKAKLDSTVRSANDELDRKEAELDARKEGRPWLADDKASPTFDDVKARIEHDHPAPGPTTRTGSGNPDFDLAKQQRAADQRLKDIRDSLGLDDDEPT
jgi:hypothetical protein